MAGNNRDTFPMSLFIEGGAARVRITHTEDTHPPARESHQQSPSPRHRMRLRSHARTSMSSSDRSGGDDLSRPHTSTSSRADALETMSEATTEIQSILEDTYSASEVSRPTSPGETTEGPFLSFTSSSVGNDNELQIWENNNITTESNFVIWEDPPSMDTPLMMSPSGWVDIEEDKENNYATLSDYGSLEEEPHIPHMDWVTATPVPRDIFGLPIETPTRPGVQGFAGGAGLVTPTVVPPIPTLAETNTRPAIRVILRNEDESEDEWDDTLSSNQIRELQELSDLYTRGAEHRRQHGRQFPMRDSNGQGQTNIFLEARRITDFQRHEGRRRSNGDIEDE